jgi:hypothetical protein
MSDKAVKIIANDRVYFNPSLLTKANLGQIILIHIVIEKWTYFQAQVAPGKTFAHQNRFILPVLHPHFETLSRAHSGTHSAAYAHVRRDNDLCNIPWE